MNHLDLQLNSLDKDLFASRREAYWNPIKLEITLLFKYATHQDKVSAIKVRLDFRLSKVR